MKFLKLNLMLMTASQANMALAGTQQFKPPNVAKREQFAFLDPLVENGAYINPIFVQNN